MELTQHKINAALRYLNHNFTEHVMSRWHLGFLFFMEMEKSDKLHAIAFVCSLIVVNQAY